jgi:hypothetical protein
LSLQQHLFDRIVRCRRVKEDGLDAAGQARVHAVYHRSHTLSRESIRHVLRRRSRRRRQIGLSDLKFADYYLFGEIKFRYIIQKIF